MLQLKSKRSIFLSIYFFSYLFLSSVYDGVVFVNYCKQVNYPSTGSFCPLWEIVNSFLFLSGIKLQSFPSSSRPFLVSIIPLQNQFSYSRVVLIVSTISCFTQREKMQSFRFLRIVLCIWCIHCKCTTKNSWKSKFDKSLRSLQRALHQIQNQ